MCDWGYETCLNKVFRVILHLAVKLFELRSFFLLHKLTYLYLWKISLDPWGDPAKGYSGACPNYLFGTSPFILTVFSFIPWNLIDLSKYKYSYLYRIFVWVSLKRFNDIYTQTTQCVIILPFSNDKLHVNFVLALCYIRTA